MMNIMDKRYLVFGFDEYYPCGGLGDLEGSFDTIEDAIAFIKKGKPLKRLHGEIIYYRSEYYQLYDRRNGVLIDIEEYGIDY